MRTTRRATIAALATIGTAGCLGYTIEDAEYVRELEEQNREQASELEDLDQELDALSAVHDELEVKVAEQGELLDSLEHERDEKAEEIARLRQELSTTERELAEQESTIAGLSADVEQLTRRRNELDAAIDEKREEIEDLEATIANIEPERTIDEEDIEAALKAAMDVRNAVAFVDSSFGRGTAFHVGDAQFLTAAHVVNGTALAPRQKLEFIDGETVSFTRESGADNVDARLLAAADEPDNTVEFGSIEAVSEADTVFIVGSPFNVGHWIISVGKFRGALEEPIPIDSLYEADAPARRRNSGSPVFDLDGTVIGMAVIELAPHDGYDAPDDAFLNFAAYDPHVGFVSIDAIVEALSL